MLRVIACVAGPALLVLLAAGCGGGTSRYAKYQDKKSAVRQIDAVIAGLPAYAGAHVSERQDSGRSYHVPSDDFIEAAPYMSVLYVDVAPAVAGSTLKRYFRKGLVARGWSCAPSPRMRSPFVVHCVHGQASVTYRIVNGHYELHVAADHRRPPIRTVPGD
jgi:hypothetical protein